VSPQDEVAAAARRISAHNFWLAVVTVSFLCWLFNSYGISNAVRSIIRLSGKMLGQ
jgi:hypothetical protein